MATEERGVVAPIEYGVQYLQELAIRHLEKGLSSEEVDRRLRSEGLHGRRVSSSSGQFIVWYSGERDYPFLTVRFRAEIAREPPRVDVIDWEVNE